MSLRKILRAIGTLAALGTIALAVVSIEAPHNLNPLSLIALGLGAIAVLTAAAQHN